MRKFATLFYWQRQHCWLRAICFRRRCRAIFWHADNDYDNYNCSAAANDYDVNNNNDDYGSTDYNYDDNDCRSSIKCYGAANYYDVNNYRPKKCLQRLDHFCIADFGNTGCQILFGGVGDMSKQNE